METPMASDEEFQPLQGLVSSPYEKGEIPVRDSPSLSSPGVPTDQGHGIRSWASLLSSWTFVCSQPEHPLEVEIQDGRFKIFIPKEAYDEMNRPFQWAALARLQGTSPNGCTNFSFVFQELTRQWAGKAHRKFTILAGGTFLIQPGQSLNMPPVTSAPLWIRLPNLPPNMWTAQIFNSIAKGLQGELLEIDTQTRDINRGGFARIRVELPLSAPLPPEFQFVLKDSHTLAQPLVYEGRLQFCRFCGINSHPPDKCPRRDSHGQGNFQHEAAKGKDTLKAASSSKGPIAHGQKSVPTSKNQFSALKDLDESQEEEPTRSPSNINDAKPLEDKTNEVHVNTTRRAKNKAIIKDVTENQTNMVNPFYRSGSLPNEIPDTSNRSFANPDPAGPAGKRKCISLGRVDALADTSPPSQTSDFPTAIGEGSVSDQYENIDSFLVFDTLINPDRLHINSSLLGSYATMTNADIIELQASLEDEDSLWRQRARVKWMAEEDRNTAYYQAIVKGRRTKNSLCALEHEGTRINYVNHIRSICENFFCDLLGSEEGSGCCLTKKDDGPRLLDEDNATLLLPATLDEVKRVVFSMDGNSASGPDGFPASFYQHHWSVVGHDLLQVINSFLSIGRLVKKVNRNYIALIPKKEGLCRVDDLRRIALCNVLYKIISKFLSYHMKRCLQKVISKDQCAFLPGHSITENIIFAHECIHSLKGLCQSNICFKIDFSKAYGRVSRVFLKNALLDLGFSMAWVDRVMTCVSSPSFAVLIDGIPGDFHPMRRGLRQGDPMSLFLFLVVMEELSRNLEFRRWNGSLIPPYIPRVGACPSLLTFADDLIIFSKGDHHSYNEVMHALDALKLSSGLCVNPHKSHAIFLGEQRTPLSFIINSDWRQGSLPLPYLGTPLFAGNMQDNLCASLVLKVEKKLSLWSSKLLSYAGRLCLIRYVLFSLVGYWCTVFMLPKTIQHKLEATMANFLWGSLEARKGVHLVAWKTICRPVLEEGVGLKRLDDWNKACIGRIMLRICRDDAPWANFIKKKYLSFHSFWTLKRPKKES
ncbi:retrotransposable element ORF2 protein [Nymphaea thermarum]|nr:retrotransposable element ORF2 protein [Nymphaea thermarum]